MLVALTSMPVMALTTAAPPRISIAVTIKFVRMQKNKNTKCAAVPQRARTISRTVCMAGHLRLISMARIAKRSTWMVAPEAYQKGPEMPKEYATLEDCSRAVRASWFEVKRGLDAEFKIWFRYEGVSGCQGKMHDSIVACLA